MPRPPLPPFTRETAIEKVRLAEDGWNTRDAAKVALAYTLDTHWRNRVEFCTTRADAQAFLTRKWHKEHDYRLIKELWAFTENRIAVRYAYEYRDDSGRWYRAYGNENWEFVGDGQWRTGTPASMKCRLRKANAYSVGPSAAGRTIILVSATWAFDHG